MKMLLRRAATRACCLLVSWAWLAVVASGQEAKKVVFLAGRPSHGYGAHEHYAGCVLLSRLLEQGMPHFKTLVIRNGWPEDASVLEDADAIVIYADGGEGHPVLPHLKELDKLADRGVGIVCIHYAVEVPKGEPGNYFLKWIGGYFETYWSVNPHWLAKFEQLPDHPITRGVQPFQIDDEWYYHMRFRENMEGVTPILTAIPPASTLDRPDGPHSGNPYVRAKIGQPQHVAWAAERPGGGRGFGFTGGHFHWNWGDPNFRRIVLNAIVWAAHAEVPQGGVPDRPVTLKDLEANQDFAPPANFDREAIRRKLRLPEDQPGERQSKEPPPATGRTSPQQQPAVSGGQAAVPVAQSPVITAKTPGHSVMLEAPIQGARQLYLVVTDAGDGFSCDWADWAEPRLIGPMGEKKLTELPWQYARTDWGQVRVNANAEGGPLRIADREIPFGIGTHAHSIIAYQIPEGYERFVARVGLDYGGTSQSGCGAAASVQFFVYTQQPPLPPRGDQAKHDPTLATAALDVAEGVQATLFASEPQLLSVTNLDIDARGRVWVCEVVNYRRHAGERPEGDRILILEDLDHDGRADTTKVYYQGRDIDSAMGICVLGNKVIVSASPNIFVFTDEDGDDRPDKKEILFSNTGQPQHDHSAHTFLFGPDGKLYWNFGNTGQKVCWPDGRIVVDMDGKQVIDNGRPYYGGMVFRCNLDGSQFEVLAHNFRNNYEITVDSFGNLWQSDNDDDGNRGVRINYVMEYGNYGYREELTGAGWQTPRTNWEDEIPRRHWHQNDPGVVPNLLHTGAGSPTGITVYEGRLLPRVFWDQVLHCDAGPNVVRAYPVQRQGAGFQAEIVNLAYGARDNWFRPADVCVAPDGSVFVTDWYDPGVGGHNMVDMDRGRIFRFAPVGQPYRVPEFDFSTVQGALEALCNPNYAVRYLAFTALQQKAEQALPLLERMARTDENPRFRARALWVLGKLSGGEQRAVRMALQDADPNLRVVGIRLSRQLAMPFVPLWREFLSKEKDLHVLRQCAIALRHNSEPGAAELWAELALRYPGDDRWYLEALGIGADGQWDAFLAAWLARAGEGAIASQAGRDIVWRSRAQQTAHLLGQIIRQGSDAAGPLDRYFRAMDFQPQEQRQEVLQKLLFEQQGAEKDRRRIVVECLERLDRRILDNSQNAERVMQLLGELPRDEQFVRLVSRYQAQPYYRDVLELAAARPSESVAVEAVRSLLQLRQERLMREWLQQQNAEKAMSFIDAMATAADGRASPLLIELVQDGARPLELRRRAVSALGRNAPGVKWMLESVKSGSFPEALRPAAASALHSSPLAEARAVALELFPLPPAKDDRPLPPLQELLARKGNVQRGQELYRSTGQCANCHRVGTEGKEVGPALTDIGNKLSRQALLESILFPSAGISHNYETYALVTTDGTVLTGLIVSQTDDTVVLKTQEAVVHQIARAEIETLRRLDVSLMPADLHKQLSAQDLVDIVEYLTTLRGTPATLSSP